MKQSEINARYHTAISNNFIGATEDDLISTGDNFYKMAIDKIHVELANADETGHSWDVLVDQYCDHLCGEIKAKHPDIKRWSYAVTEEAYMTPDDGQRFAMVVKVWVV